MASAGAVLSTAVDLVARVECRSEGLPEQLPVAIHFGGRRLEVRVVLADAVVGALDAGAPAVRRLSVELVDGRRLELRRRLPDGEWRVSDPKGGG